MESHGNKIVCSVSVASANSGNREKVAHNQETFPRKMAKFRLWKNTEGHDRGPGKVMEFSEL